MACSKSTLLLGLVVIVVYGASVDLLKEDKEDHILSSQAPSSDLSSSLDVEDDADSTALFQTYVSVTSNRSEEGAAKANVHTLERVWRWVTQASADDISEPAQRSHKDFIAAALLITCVLPWSSSLNANEGTHRATMDRLSRALPSGQTLRYLCVFLLWLKHYCFKGQHTIFEVVFVLVGTIFDFADQHVDYEDDMWRRLGDCVPKRFARLYPLYSLHVIGCYLVFFSAPCSAFEAFLGGNLLPFYACGIAAWLSSLCFAVYLVVTLLASPADHLESSSMAMMNAGCVAMVVLPRTLAAPVHGPWTWTDEKASQLQADPDAALFELFFARRSLLIALAHFFLGLVLARIRLLFTGANTDVTETECKEPQVEMAASSGTHGRAVRRLDEDLWREFEDEAQREMIQALSVNKAAEHTDTAISISPRSSTSD